jgi:hypothetical protein
MIRLFTVWYDAKSPGRQGELQECLRRNLGNPHIEQVVLWKYSGVTPGAESKLTVREENHPPTFDEIFALANTVCAPGDVAVISNSDVWYDDTAVLVEKIEPNQCYALLRWESNGKLYATREGKPRRDAQDAWIFRTPIRPVGTDFGLGCPRNDNALAYLLCRCGYDLHNPAKTIHIHHLHASGVRPFTAKKYRIPPPWMHVEATELHERGQTWLLRKTFSLKWYFRRLRRRLTRLKV